MYFELQMSGAVFTRVVRNRLRSIPLGVDLSLPDPGGEMVVDRIVIGDATTLQREQTIDYSTGVPVVTNTATQFVRVLSPQNLGSFTVPYVQIRQEVRILLVRAADLDTNGPAPTPPASTLTIFPVFNVSLKADNQTQGGGPLMLSYSLAYVDFGLAGLLLDDAQRSQITQIVGGVKIDPAVVDLGAMGRLMGRATSAINAGIACDPAGTRVALRADFDIHASPIAITREFFEAGPADLLAGKEWAMLMDANALARDATERVKAALGAKANLRILSDPEGTWDPAETTLRVTAKIRLIRACPGIGDDIDMDVRVDLGARFNVPAPTPDHLVIHYQLDSEMTDNDQVFGCALTGALLYPFAGAALFEDKKIDLLDYLGGIAFGPYISFGQLVGVINAQKLEDDISGSLGDTCHKLNDSEYECTTAVNMVIQLVPTLNSRFVLQRAHEVPEGVVLSGPVANLGELFLGSIGDIGMRPFKWQVLGACTGNGKNNFRIGNEAKILVPYTPPAKVIKARLLSAGYSLAINDNELTVTPNNPPVAAPCRIRLITNRGVRTLTIPPAKALTEGERDALDTALLGAGLTCFYWEKEFTPIEKILWRVDPAFHVIGEGAVRQWQILLKALNPASRLTVRTADGVTVATGRPSRNGTLHLSLMFADRGGPEELAFQLDRPGQSEGSPVEVSVHQTLYDLRASVPVSGELRRAEFTGSLRKPQLSVRTGREALRWDVSAPLAPQLLEATSLRAEPDHAEPDAPTSDYGLEAGRAAAMHVARALKAIFKGDEHPLAIGARRVRGFANTLYLPTEQGASVYDISTPDEPLEIHCLSGERHEVTASTQNLMARHDRSRNMLDIYEVVARHTV